jgi:hypothetical protein
VARRADPRKAPAVDRWASRTRKAGNPRRFAEEQKERPAVKTQLFGGAGTERPLGRPPEASIRGRHAMRKGPPLVRCSYRTPRGGQKAAGKR